MGIGGISPVQLMIILVIVLLIFGTKKLRSLGGDLGGAIKGFKKAVKEEDAEKVPDADVENNDVENSDVESVAAKSDITKKATTKKATTKKDTTKKES